MGLGHSLAKGAYEMGGLGRRQAVEKADDGRA